MAPQVKAKTQLLGAKASASKTPEASTSALPARRPLGQEDDSDDGDDIDFEDVLDGDETVQSLRALDGDGDEVMITDGVTIDSAAAKSTSKGKGGSSNTATGTDSLMSIDVTNKPTFRPLSKASAQSARDAMDVAQGQLRKVPIPPHRMTPLKNEWTKIYTPLVEMAGLQVRMNVKRKQVEIKVSTA